MKILENQLLNFIPFQVVFIDQTNTRLIEHKPLVYFLL